MTEQDNGRIRCAASMLVVVDIQARLAPAISGIDGVIARTSALIEGARGLAVPVVFTEQYPSGLGPTAPALRSLAPEAPVIEKIHFDVMAEPHAPAAFAATGRQTAVVTGTEAHVCVMQSCHGLMDAGYRVALVVDAIGSRREVDRQAAIAALTRRGALTVTTEMVLFQWLERGDTDAFRALLPTIRDLSTV
ncbi:MAG: isochorismatase family protein [Pseudomonadota bacterium]